MSIDSGDFGLASGADLGLVGCFNVGPGPIAVVDLGNGPSMIQGGHQAMPVGLLGVSELVSSGEGRPVEVRDRPGQQLLGQRDNVLIGFRHGAIVLGGVAPGTLADNYHFRVSISRYDAVCPNWSARQSTVLLEVVSGGIRCPR